jgi:hypothetical protein
MPGISGLEVAGRNAEQASHGGADHRRRRAGSRHVLSVLGVSDRRTCRTLGQPQPTQRKARMVRADERR